MKAQFICGGVLVLLLVSGMASGQATAPTSTPASSGSVDRTPEGASDIGKDVKRTTLENQAHSGDYLTGNVNVEGNPLLWEPVPVTIYCDGQSRAQTYADAKGQFKFESTRMEGPAVQQPKKVILTALYTGCTVKATLAGYQSSVLTIGSRNLSDNPDVGTVKLTIDEHANGTALSATSAAAPKNAVKAFEKARQEWTRSPKRQQSTCRKPSTHIRSSPWLGTSSACCN